MEFDKSKVYGLINADRKMIGCKGYFAYTLESLKEQVAEGDKKRIFTLTDVFDEDRSMRYQSENLTTFNLFYFVEKPEETKKLPLDELENRAITFAMKYVCKNCKVGCKQVDQLKQVDLLCGCVRYYMNAFMDGYRDCENRDEK